MKSPEDIAAQLCRQWQRSQFRLAMLSTRESWPMCYSIGLPAASDLTTRPETLRVHIKRWQSVRVGKVVWRELNYRASSEPIRMPFEWMLERPSDWVRAAGSEDVRTEFDQLESLLGHVEPPLHKPLILNLRLLRRRTHDELVDATMLAARLQAGEAQGRPLRLLAGHGVDTKFFERNRKLLTCLLDARFDDAVSDTGLENFLDASPDNEHWLLVAPLQPGLLPFERLQLRTQELRTLAPEAIAATHILVIENRQCLHSLPRLDNTVAILGAGLDLDWLKGAWLDKRNLAYWGDIDTWGLTMLARARRARPCLTAVLMDQTTFLDEADNSAVKEPVIAADVPPPGLRNDEQSLYRWLLTRERGRLEQEYVSIDRVRAALMRWQKR